jgi:DnaJ-class molecular chaperone
VTPTAAPPTDRDRCHACRGTGQVTSGLGGTPHQVECPWCDGTGRFIAEHDAQAARVSS